jgi:peptide-methionine (S)-S-oxide reductase
MDIPGDHVSFRRAMKNCVPLIATMLFLAGLNPAGAAGPMNPTNSTPASGHELVTFGGGCFWCLEAIFEQVQGVVHVASGYAGGTVTNPTYKQVCTGTTGHAESIQVTFDPKRISLKDLLTMFFTMHDPTTLNRQGADVGPQYRSVIFYRTPAQQAVAEQVIREITAAKLWEAPIVTRVVPFRAFYKAEDYHQEYYRLHREQPYCRAVIAPKVAKFRDHFRDKLNVP